MLPNYYPQASITTSAPDGIFNPITAPTVSGLVNEVPEGAVLPPSEILSTVDTLSSPESSWDKTNPESVWLLEKAPVGQVALIEATPRMTLTEVIKPTSVFEFDYPTVNQFLKLPSPFGTVEQLTTPTSAILIVPSPNGRLTITPTPNSTIFVQKTPTATLTSIFYTPVLALDEGFLWLDDGGRLEIGY